MAKNEIFIERFKELLKESKYSQKQIAELCHTTEASLSRYVNGERMPKPEVLANLATALHTTTDYLLGKSDRFADFNELKALIARSKNYYTDEQRKELSEILIDINDRIEMGK
jgi:transcriptional regulator with XRE-family HTH domain